MTTWAPAATNPPAIIRPMPRVPPVTTTVFPATVKSWSGGVGAGERSVMGGDGSARRPDWPVAGSRGPRRWGMDPGRWLLGCGRTWEDEHAPGPDGRTAGAAGPSFETTSPGWWTKRSAPTTRAVLHPATSAGWAQDGWLGLGWPPEYGGQGRGPIDQMIFVEESHWAGVPLPLLTLNSVGPTLMSLGTDEQKERLLPGILRGEVHFSIGYTEPTAGTDLASLQDPGRPRRRRVRDHRREDLYQRHPVCRLRLAGRPDRSRRAQAQGTLGVHRPRGRAGVPLDAAAHHGRRVHQRHVLRRRAGAGGQPGRGGEPGLEADHQPAQPRTGGHLPGVGDPAQHRRRGGVGPGRRLGRRAPGDGPEWVQIHLARVAGQGRIPQAVQLEGGLGGRTRASTPPMPRPPRCSGPSSPSRPTASCSRWWARRATSRRAHPGRCFGAGWNRPRSQTIFTFGGGTNEVQRDIIAMIGLGMPRAPR